MFRTQSLAFSVRIPVIMSLIMFVVFIEGIIQVTIHPVELGNMTQVIRHLRVVIWSILIPGSNGIESLVKVRVDNLVAKIVVTLLPIVLWHVRRVKVDLCHI